MPILLCMDAPVPLTLGQKLGLFAETHKLIAIAKAAGVSSGTLAKYIHHGVTPSSKIALRLARALGVSVEWLIDDTQGWPPVWDRKSAPSKPRPSRRTPVPAGPEPD